MSLSGAGTADNNCGIDNQDPLHTAICRARDAGVTIVVAAGNSGAAVSGFIPAAYNDSVITVSALGDYDGMQGARANSSDDFFASFSNYDSGTSIIDIGAPGVNILSTFPVGGSPLGTNYGVISGTSMATPHVAGAAALYIAAHPGATWSQVKSALIAGAETASLITHKDVDTLGHQHLEPVVLVGPNPTLPPLPGNNISFKVSSSNYPFLDAVAGGTTGKVVAIYALHGVTNM
jgi:subtilisin family serine protease